MFLKDIIGDEYKKWTNKDTVFISTQTGSGKTTFIFDTLIPYLAELESRDWINESNRQSNIRDREFLNNIAKADDPVDEENPVILKEKVEKQNREWDRIKNFIPPMPRRRILYLVNRSILKDQLVKESTEKLGLELRHLVEIYTYQEIEKRLQSGIQFDLNQYGSVVCDEAHYFMADSCFNTETTASFYFVTQMLQNKLRIFMSATIEEVKEYIENDIKYDRYMRSDYYGIPNFGVWSYPEFIQKQMRKSYNYTDNRDYSHIEIDIIDDMEDIARVIREDDLKCKWLVFMNDKKEGEELKDHLKKELNNSKNEKTYNIETISSESKDSESYEEIANDSRFSADILITTSVMDNGVNIKDIDLRKIIVIADTETEFLQAIGRKRVRENESFKLYIMKRKEQYFRNRWRAFEKTYTIALEYYEKLLNVRDMNSMVTIYRRDYGAWTASEQQLMYFENQNICQHLAESGKGLEYHSWIQKAFYYNRVNRCFMLNLLSLQHIDNLRKYYNVEVPKQFERYGDDAFIWMQLRWLGKTDEEIEAIIQDHALSLKDKVIMELRKYTQSSLGKKDWCAALDSNGLRKNLRILLEKLQRQGTNYPQDTFKTAYATMSKKGREISKQSMDFLRQYCGLPFAITVESGTYTLEEVDSNSETAPDSAGINVE